MGGFSYSLELMITTHRGTEKPASVCRGPSASDVRRKDQEAVIFCKRCFQVADELVAVQVRRDRGMEAVCRDELGQGRAPRRQRAEQLAEGVGLDFQFGYASTLARNAQKFNEHHVPGRQRRTACLDEAQRAEAGNLMITWAFNP
jgi:hypothetical protein